MLAASLALNEKKIVSNRMMFTPPSTKASTASRQATPMEAKSIERFLGSLTSGETERVLLLGPSTPATKLGRSELACWQRQSLASVRTTLRYAYFADCHIKKAAEHIGQTIGDVTGL